jgi:hypothetical protein
LGTISFAPKGEVKNGPQGDLEAGLDFHFRRIFEPRFESVQDGRLLVFARADHERKAEAVAVPGANVANICFGHFDQFSTKMAIFLSQRPLVPLLLLSFPFFLIILFVQVYVQLST